MNYEEKYNNAIESIKRIYEQADSFGKELMEKEFPELRESEDERIRKALIKYLDALDDDEIRYGVSFKDMRTWLEKQGEQKPCSEDDESMLLMCSDAIAASCAAGYYITEEMNKMQNWLKSLKPNHWKPSEEQMKHLKSISVGWHPSLDDCRILSSLYNDLLKL